jgi:nitrogen fixation protein NifZ
VEFVDSGHRVGMRAKELCTLDHLPPEVTAALGDKFEQLQELR